MTFTSQPEMFLFGSPGWWGRGSGTGATCIRGPEPGAAQHALGAEACEHFEPDARLRPEGGSAGRFSGPELPPAA